MPGARQRAENGELAFGTIDSWLVWQLIGGERHVTDASNASRTLLLEHRHRRAGTTSCSTGCAFPAPCCRKSCRRHSARTHRSPRSAPTRIPIAGIAGDQQAALFGQACFEPGMAKNTYGTGCFLLMNTGTTPLASDNRLLTTIAWQTTDRRVMRSKAPCSSAAPSCSGCGTGSASSNAPADIEALAASVPDAGGVYLVPAFTGLGSPHWDAYARGTMVGLSRGTTRAHIARAALEAIAFQSAEVLLAMQRDARHPLVELRVDGGATANDLLMQFQADLLGVPVVRPRVTETTALGAAYLAGLGTGFWSSPAEVAANWRVDRRFEPRMSRDEAGARLARWGQAVERSRGWHVED